MEEHSVIQVGGTVEKAVKGEYRIDVKAVLSEGWQLTKASRISINLGLMFCIALGMLITFTVSQYFGGIEAIFKDQQAFTLLNIVVTLIIYPFLVGVEMMGVFHSVGIKTHPKLVFGFLKRGSWVAICALFASTLTSIGLSLLILPGVYLIVALSLVLPLVAEKRMSPVKAIMVSLQATRHQWFSLFAIYLALFFIFVLCFVPVQLFASSGVPMVGGVITILILSFLAPMFYNVKGILYREIFGMQLALSKGTSGSVDSTFSA
ncbi:hypothetical protein [Thalassotalea marina]|uniref:Glycerophosphoryl diester phosphodiesterase membrane domain-containing protein n=1 Tax=Thalassotalea marina TaxID=1673741 RepID=A0A919EJD3_9GAMM|nr:hypothetical protein [Thalassotalea marina]GHF90835.1 hypothetical protein GCM10017161_18240 [Thalassotalea marina]